MKASQIRITPKDNAAASANEMTHLADAVMSNEESNSMSQSDADLCAKALEVFGTFLNKRSKRSRNDADQIGCKLCGETLFSPEEAIEHLQGDHGKELERNPQASLIAKQIRSLETPGESPQPQVPQRPDPPAEKSRPPLKPIQRKYSCSICSSSNNNYEIMIGHVNNKHDLSLGAKLIVHNGPDDESKTLSPSEVANLASKISRRHNKMIVAATQMRKSIQPDLDLVAQESQSSKPDSISSAAPELSLLPTDKEKDDDLSEAAQFDSNPIKRRPISSENSSSFKDKLLRIIEKQGVFFEEGIQHLNDKSESLDKKTNNLNSHITNVNTRLDFMDSRLTTIEQKLSKLMRLIGNA